MESDLDSLLSIRTAISCLIGMLGVPVGILPSVFLFRGLANGADAHPQTKHRYAITLWGGMFIGWLLASYITWRLIGVWWA